MLNKHSVFSQQIFRDSFWGLVGNVIGKGLSFIAGIFVARWLGSDVYGEYGIVRNTLLTVSVFSTFGMGYSATKYVAEYLNRDSSAVKQIVSVAIKVTIIFSSLMAVLLFIFSRVIAELLNEPSIYLSLRFLSVIIVLNAVTTTQIGILAGFKAFRGMAITNTITGLITFVLSLLLTFISGLNGALLALLLAQLVNCIINYILLRKTLSKLPLQSELNIVDVKSLINFSAPIAIQESLYSLSSWAALFILSRYGSSADVGVNTAVAQWTNIILFIPGVLRNVALSYFSSTLDDNNEHKKVLKSVVIVNFISTFIPFVLILFLGNYIVRFYGESYSQMGPVLNIAVFGTIFNCVTVAYLQELVSKGRNWLVLSARTCRDILCIALTLLLIYKIKTLNVVLLYNIAVTFTMISFFFIVRFFVNNDKTIRY